MANDIYFAVPLKVKEIESVAEFLEAEFIKDGKGIGADPDIADQDYVKNIRAVYEKLNRILEEESPA